MAHERVGPVNAIGRRVRELRKRRDMTAEDLAWAISRNGVRWDRTTVTKLETNKRQNVTVTELFVLAKVLGVAPVHLLVPLEDDVAYQVTPGEEEPALVEDARTVRAWIRGFQIIQDADPRTFWAEVPAAEFGKQENDPAYRAWVRQVVKYLARSMGRLYRRDDGTGVFEVDLPAEHGQEDSGDAGR